MATELRVYGGATGDERRESRRARLIAAGFELLVDDGPLAFTVRGVRRKAGLGSRYFYENFENADELAAAIYDEHTMAVTSGALAAIEDTEVGDIPGLARVFSSALEAVPAIEERREASIRLFVGLVIDEITNRLAVPDGPAVAIAAEMLIGGITQALAVWLDDGIETSQEDFVAECTDIFVAVPAELTRRAA